MKLLKNKIIWLLALPFMLFSCSEWQNSAAKNGYVEISVKRSSSGNTESYQTYVFDVAPNGADKIYAARATADDDASVEQYIIRALSDTDVPFNAVEVHLVPASADGSRAAMATVRIGEYKDSYKTTTTGFFWTVTGEDHGLKSQDYHIPLAEGGIFTFDFVTSEDDGVYEKGYNNNTSNYPLLKIKVAAPVSTY